MKKLLLSLSVALAAALGAHADTVNIDFSSLGYANAEDVTTVDTKSSEISIVCEQGTNKNNPPKYYNTGTGLRLYSENTMTISASEGYEISKIVFTASGTNYVVKGSTKDVDGKDNGTFNTSGSISTWTGNSNKIILNSSSTCRLQKMEITYEYVALSAVEPVEIKYTLNKADGIVTLSCATEGAKIYYGFSADQMVNEYTEPFTVKENCTVYAYAEKGDDKSITKSAYIDLPYTSFKKVLDNSELTDNIVIVGDFEVIYQNVDKGRLILTDGTSNILIYRNSSDYSIDYPVGTKISKIEGVRAAYNSCFRLIDAELTEGGNGAEYTPIELSSFEGLSYDDNLFDEVVIKGCNISGKDLGSPVIEMGDETVALYDVFGIGYENVSGCDVTGFVWRYKDILEIVPISITGGEVTGTVETPVITPNKRELDLDEEVTITCPTEGAVIYYTLDGTEPTQESEKYTAPIPFKESCTIKARAYYENTDKTMFPSAIATRDYHVIDPTCNVITEGNHDADENNTLNKYIKHAHTVDGVEYHMNAAHLGEGGNGNDGSASSIMMNNSTTKDKERFCYLIQVGENEGYVLDKIELAYNNEAKTIFAVRGSNTPFDDSAEALKDYKEAIESQGSLIGNISKDSQSIEFAKDYKYFALYPTNTGAVYLDNITIRYREPVPFEAPELKGIENLMDMTEEDDPCFMLYGTEAVTLSFDELDGVNIYYSLMDTSFGGYAKAAALADEEEPGMEAILYEEPIVLDKKGGYTLVYWAEDTDMEVRSEEKIYMIVLDIPAVAPAVPELKGIESLIDMSEEDDPYIALYGDEAVTLSFDKVDGVDIYYSLMDTSFGGLTKAAALADDEEPEMPSELYKEPIVLDKSGCFTLVYWAVDTETELKSEEKVYMILLDIPAVAPAAPEIVGEGYRIDGDYMLSENVVKINFKVAEGTHIYYQVSADEEPMKTRACEDEHAGFTKHEGEDIELSHMHKTFTYFACDPATGLHSEPVTLNLTVATGISEIDAENADVLYFDLNGLRVINPEKGTYIRVQKGKAEKVVK